MEAGRIMKTYKSVVATTGAALGAAGFFLLGIVMIVPSKQVGVGGAVIGAAIMIVALALAVSAVQNRTVVTTNGITYWFNFRKHEIPWISVQSFEVGRAQGPGPWYSIIVNSPSGPTRINAIVGTRSSVQRIAAELSSFQRDRAASSAGL